MRRSCKTISVDVDVDLSDFHDDDIREEYENRFGLTARLNADDGDEALEAVRKIRTLILCGQNAAAIDAMREFAREALGTAI